MDPVICGALWTALLLGILHGRGLMRRMLEWPPLRYLGLISYSAYLWHLKILSDVSGLHLPPQLGLLVFFAVVIAVSSVSYFLIEKPLSRMRLENGRLVAGRPALHK
jgi:peptidoglycan/LPS O-acetylase OafA/YrhL